MKKLFRIDIGEDEHGCYAIVESVQEKKARSISASNIKLLLTEISKTVRKRVRFMHSFPISEPSPILTLEQDYQRLRGSNGQ